MEDIDKIFSFHGNNKVNLFQSKKNETAFVIQCTKEIFESQATEYFKCIYIKKANEGRVFSKKGIFLKEKIKKREKKKSIAKCLKEVHKEKS